MRSLILSICLAFLASTSVQSLEPGVFVSANCNEWVEKMLVNMRPLCIEKNGDPAALPDMNLPFNYTFLFTDHQGWLNLSDGYAIGLSTIQKGGDCMINYEMGLLRLAIDFHVDDITIDAKHSTHVVGFDLAGTLLASMQSVPIVAHILVDVKQSTASLQHFAINEIGDLKISMDGLGLLGDALLSVILAVIDNLFKTKVVEVLTEQIALVMTDILDEITFLPPIPDSTPPPVQFHYKGFY